MEAQSFVSALREFAKIDHAQCNALFASHGLEVVNAYSKSKGDSSLFGLAFVCAWELAALIGTVVVWVRPAEKASNWLGRVMLPLFAVCGIVGVFAALFAAANYAAVCSDLVDGGKGLHEPFALPSIIALLPIAVFFTFGALMCRYPRFIATANYQMRHPGRVVDENDWSFKTTLYMQPIMGVLFMAFMVVIGWSVIAGFFATPAVR